MATNLIPAVQSYMSQIRKLLPGFQDAPQAPVAKTAVAETDPDADFKKWLMQSNQPGGGGANPALTGAVLEKLMKPEHVDTVGEINKTSNIHGGAGNPFYNGSFKSMKDAFADTGVRKGDGVIPPFANPAAARFRGETVEVPGAFGSSFVGNSGDTLNKDGMATGRSLAVGAGSGHSDFATPQAPTGSRLFSDDQARQIASLLGPKPQPKPPVYPGQGAFAMNAGQQPRF